MKPLARTSSSNDFTVFCDTDAAWRSDLMAAGMGWILTDRHGQEISRATASQLNVTSACMAEALAIREALINASTQHITHICFRTDSQVLARAITARRTSTELYGILSDIDSLTSSPSSPFTKCSVVFIPRARNGPADLLAKSCLANFIMGLRP
ncbi:uncharacterized protein BNAC07G25150D [Brassica napus]|uniref:RNase H type-1 domain-containing protein n=1 Tax=Brassica oleracea TaxID=3712 RepID=A0A3P6ERB6_BRAOL|nr:uncharacterized protein BNAC07G25150D [Brassica napus]VDD38711.1 unnamed protein product [Brassica oleracea]